MAYRIFQKIKNNLFNQILIFVVSIPVIIAIINIIIAEITLMGVKKSNFKKGYVNAKLIATVPITADTIP